MYHPDLTPLPFPPFDSGKFVAVGWLESGYDFQQGEAELEFVRKLAELLHDPWQPAVTAGRHACGFCRLTGGPTSFQIDHPGSRLSVEMGVANLWLPADGFLYVAPSMILHYMDAHGYSPPDAFQKAVSACPPMRSMAYLRAVLKNGPKGLVTK